MSPKQEAWLSSDFTQSLMDNTPTTMDTKAMGIQQKLGK